MANFYDCFFESLHAPRYLEQRIFPSPISTFQWRKMSSLLKIHIFSRNWAENSGFLKQMIFSDTPATCSPKMDLYLELFFSESTEEEGEDGLAKNKGMMMKREVRNLH